MPKINIDEIKVNYNKSGKGPPIVLLHGHGGNLHTFDPLIRRLSKKYTVYRYDQRGYGNTDKPLNPLYTTELWVDDLNKFISQIGLEKIHLGGHSMSGRICATYVKKFPNKVQSLITFNTTWFGSNPQAADNLLKTANIIEKEGMGIVVKNSRSLNSIPSNKKNIYKQVKNMMLQNEAKSYANGSKAVAYDFKNGERTDILKSIKCPTLITIGDRDSAPLQGAITMLRGIQNARLAVIPGSGHYTILEKPNIIGAVIKDFLEEIGD